MKREVNIDGEMEFVRALSISTLATRAETTRAPGNALPGAQHMTPICLLGLGRTASTLIA